ncbi:MAG: glycosyltransferase [Fusobacteriaceae bacterium]
MQKPKVSVVIPVYNVELYLREALNSVINQTLKEIEIIVVNDGSTDSSLEIIKEYEKKDNRIVVINQENKGLSCARNSGLRIASGEYIYFMDSDDYISLDTLEICYTNSLENNLDFIFFDAKSFTNDNIDISGYDYDRSSTISEKTIFSGAEILKQLLDKKKYRSAAVLNFINLNFLKEIKLEFYPGILHEDELFTFLLFIFSKKTSYINRKFFQRRVRPNSIMTNQKGEKNMIGYLTIIREFKKIRLIEKNELKRNLLNRRIQNILGNYISLLELLDKKTVQNSKMNIKKEFSENLSLRNKIQFNYPYAFKIIKNIKHFIG